MVWSSTSPDGTKSVKQNTTPMQENTTYTETTMSVDHFWNEGVNQDGRHQFVQSPKYEDPIGTPSSPVLGADMDLVTFSRLKTATESVDQQDVQPYARNDSAIMQLLGIRACVLFNIVGGAIVVKYSHNVTSVTRSGLSGAGAFVITYTAALPSNDYIPVMSCQHNSTSHQKILLTAVPSNAALNVYKTVNACTMITTATDQTYIDPLQGSFFCFGG